MILSCLKILPNFLFDAEKIVNIAEVKSLDEKRRLSTAYSEV